MFFIFSFEKLEKFSFFDEDDFDLDLDTDFEAEIAYEIDFELVKFLT